MIGHKLGHYTVVERIGAGGMGEVYRARDEHLARDVAIKVLPAGTLADESARRRFRAEAEALARLNHPHIATVHDFNSQEGTDFLVMEYVPGSSLSDHLAGGSLPEKEVLRLAMQVTAALEEAHENRIVHRDLKPANIRLTAKGNAKVLDFGLAKLLRSVDDINTQSLTQSQAVVGTLPYMAPEQLRGQPADARTDIYAFGCVLYEMATGRRPFQETVSATLTDAILNRPAPSPRHLSAQLSGELERMILKCLEKDPENRYQSAKELAVDLRRLAVPSALAPTVQPSGSRRWDRYALIAAGLAAIVLAVLVGFNVGGLRERLFGPATPKIDSIAVLPLDNLSGDPEQEYFTDGMTEALTTELSKISALKVISRTSAMHYKGVKKPPMPQIARELGVDGLIEGSVQREGDQVRITVQLIHGPTDKHLWAESYQRELRGILALQSEVARDIAQEIRVQLTPQEQVRLAGARPANPEAYEAYLKGVYFSNQFVNEQREEPLRKNLAFFEEAIRIDPSFAPAYAYLSFGYGILAQDFGYPDLYPKAQAAAMKALALDDELPDAHAALAYLKVHHDWDWAGAERESKRALELNPNYGWAHDSYGRCLWVAGRYEEALAEFKRAEEVDPLVLVHKANIGWTYYCARQYDQAIEQFRRTLPLSPNSAWLHDQLGQAYVSKGMFNEALAEIEKAIELSGGDPKYKASLAYAYAMSGKRSEAIGILNESKESGKRGTMSALNRASVYSALGEEEQAFIWLEKAYEERSPGLPFINCYPEFDNLRDDPRFKHLLQRMNFPE